MKDEHYVIPGVSFAHIRKGEFQDKTKAGCYVMVGGCGIGHKDNITEARKHLYQYAKNKLMQSIKEHQAIIDIANKTLKELGDDEFNLGIFKNPNYHGFECNFFNGTKG